MSFLSIGDLAQSFQLRRQTTDLKAALARHGQELTTGRVADPARALRGHYIPLAGIEHGRTRLAAFVAAAKETAIHATGMQDRLSQLMADSASTAAQMVTVTAGATPGIVDSVAATGRGAFEAAVSALNTSVGDRSLFAGTATDGAALASAADILAALAADTAGLTTAASLQAAVTDWFNSPGGGFETMGFLGSGTSLGPIAIGPDDSVTLQGSAASPEIRASLAGFALAALVDQGALAGDQSARAEALRRAGQTLTVAQTGLTGLAARIGTIEARIDTIATRNAAESTALDFARQDLLDADPFEAGTRLEETRARLEMLFQVTARLSRLNLSDHLR